MNILQLNTSDIEGGAARAAYRIHKAIIAQGINSEMFVQNKKSDDYTVKVANSKIGKVANKLRPHLDGLNKYFYKEKKNVPWSANCVANDNVVKQVHGIYDLIHMHWICGGFFSIEDVAKFKKPIVWTLHDTWIFTGGCHYFGECDKYLQECHSCHQLGSNNKDDLSRKLFYKKQKSYSRSDITIVTPSVWLADCAKKSFLLQEKKVAVIPNCLDINTYQRLNKEFVRKIMNIDFDEKVIVFGAMNATGDPRKGFVHLEKALETLKKILPNENKISIIVFGSSKPKIEQNLGFKMYYTGHLHDDLSLAIVYNCADVFVAPSREDNLPNTVIESLACGTPCVAFDIGGMPDMIQHKVNGYLAQPFEAEDLARGINYVLEDEVRWREMSTNARAYAVANYAPDIIANKYINLYKEILSESREDRMKNMLKYNGGG